MPQNNNGELNQFPSWALDPVLGTVMISPVKIKPCNHVVNKMTMMAYCNMMCPVCQGGISKVKPDKKLAKKIKSLKVCAMKCRLQPKEIDSLAFELEDAKGDDLVAILEEEDNEDDEQEDHNYSAGAAGVNQLLKSKLHHRLEQDASGLTDESCESDNGLSNDFPPSSPSSGSRRQQQQNRNLQQKGRSSMKKMLSKVFHKNAQR